MKALAVLILVVTLAGCTAPIVPPVPTVELEILEVDQGWVQVKVAGISAPGFTIQWGDAATSYGRSDVLPGQDTYSHFYQAVDGERSGEQVPTEYLITLLDEDGRFAAQEKVLIPVSVCHLELIGLDGREVIVEYWGRFGIEYSISWGDRIADHVMVSMQTGRGIAQHTYALPGTYSLGMEEIWAPRRVFLTVTVR